MKKNQKICYQNGQAMIITVILFLILALVAVFGMVNPLIRHANATRSVLDSKQGFYLAEAGMEDVVYRLKNSMQTAPSNSLSLNGETAVTLVSDTLDGKILTTTGNSNNFIRKLDVELITGIGAAFNYGVQAGTGGFLLANNSGVKGNVYSGGPINGGSGSYITNSAFSANSAASAVDQENYFPPIPASQIVFGNADATQDVAQSFSVSQNAPIGKVAFFIKKIGSPSNITIRIVTDNAGSPSNNTLSSATLSASLVTSSFGWVEIPITTNFDLTAGTTYWIVLDTGTSASKYYTWAANTSYTSGVGKIGRYGVSWNNTSPIGLDGYFKVYLGGLVGSINGVDIGTEVISDAGAHSVTNSDVTGILYCQTGSGNNKACNTSRPDPTPLPYPISQANIDKWKNEAESGNIINGNVNLSGSSSNMGPTKIIGNLTISNNYILTITGTIWVTGNINMSNNVAVKLDPGYGAASGSIISDGKISLSNNVDFQGSGQENSYIMLLTTSDCPLNISCAGSPAINVANNAGTVILNAQQGTIHFSNNSGAKEATANLISLDNNAFIEYHTGLSNVNFVSGPSGGFDILRWKEIE